MQPNHYLSVSINYLLLRNFHPTTHWLATNCLQFTSSLLTPLIVSPTENFSRFTLLSIIFDSTTIHVCNCYKNQAIKWARIIKEVSQKPRCKWLKVKMMVHINKRAILMRKLNTEKFPHLHSIKSVKLFKNKTNQIQNIYF